MDWVLEHPAEASVLGNRGRSRMSIYERDNIIRLHEDLYTRLLNYASKESPRRLSRNSRQG
jgi:hypothetical protein